MTLQAALPFEWRQRLASELEQPYLQTLARFVDDEREKGPVFPPEDAVFRAFELTPFDSIRVVLLGQDPYHGEGQAHGLSFSVEKGLKFPPSLRNIFKERASDLGLPVPEHGSLEAWASQGVLLLNTVLTVREGEAHSHRSRGWEKFTDAVIRLIDAEASPCVFLLWGKPAQKSAS